MISNINNFQKQSVSFTIKYSLEEQSQSHRANVSRQNDLSAPQLLDFHAQKFHFDWPDDGKTDRYKKEKYTGRKRQQTEEQK